MVHTWAAAADVAGAAGAWFIWKCTKMPLVINTLKCGRLLVVGCDLTVISCL